MTPGRPTARKRPRAELSEASRLLGSSRKFVPARRYRAGGGGAHDRIRAADPRATGPSATGRTLEEIEAQPWDDPPANASSLVARSYGLRRVPLVELGTEDLRILLGQSIGAPTLVPFALRMLADDPLS
ncbi:MAG: contact-dependent growth inhibition system immunity protein [Janthinobacterium lividum]